MGRRRCCTAGALALLTGTASAHSFGPLYNLPVPLWLYVYGVLGALGLSFLLIAWFATSVPALSTRLTRDEPATTPIHPSLVIGLRIIGLTGLLLCLLTGLLGSPDPNANLSMTAFWIGFVLGLTYLCAVVGDLYQFLNPWQTLAGLLARLWPGYGVGRFAWPRALASWPAVLLYMGFIGFELLGHGGPFALATVLAAYTALNLFGVWLFGRAAWFAHGEFFSVFFALVGRCAPVAWSAQGGWRRRRPFAGVLEQPATDTSQLVFVLFMLSSTALDGLMATVPWFRFSWVRPLAALQPWVAAHPTVAFAWLKTAYVAWQATCLVLSPILYLLVYVAFMVLVRRAGGGHLPLRTLALRFAYTLLPIALVYHVTHYFTLLITQGPSLMFLASDPFGRGWNLWGTANFFRLPILPSMGWIWHVQVGLILFGHVVSVYLAHLEALRVFGSRNAATRSQLPMLALMMMFTAAGLWILAQPIQEGL